MTLAELKKSENIIFECISGSRAYGLDTPSSDTDIKGVFVLSKEKYLGLEYVGQISNKTNDVVFYELGRFVELCYNNNPNILEMLNTPDECILQKHPLFDRLRADMFLSKKCELSFGKYAYSQIKKARGLNKKIVNPVSQERKTIFDFSYVYAEGKSIQLKEFLSSRSLNQKNCGLSKVPHLKDAYNLFHDENNLFDGIMSSDMANDVSLSNIPKETSPLALMFFNKDAYSTYCKKYKEYWNWVEKRNESRYEATLAHGKNYDAKNVMHTFRLLHMAKEIALDGVINVKRSDREYLLEIKAGKFEYDDLINNAEILKLELAELFEKSVLPDEPNFDEINAVLVEMREEFYSNI